MVINIKKQDGTFEEFNSQKLIASLIRSGADEKIARTISESLESSLPDETRTDVVYKEAFRMLKKVKTKKPIVRYSLKRSILALGPTGFPFEQLIAEIMRAEGYDSATNLIISGTCARHEIDVAFVKNGKAHIIEAKFHNQEGYQTDLKTVLYVKARVLDLCNSTISISGKEYTSCLGMVATNTKFTEAALDYSQCAGLELLSWGGEGNYNLHDLIEKHSLYPITVLQSLTMQQKKAYIQEGIITCKQLAQEEGVSKVVGSEINQILTHF